MTIGVRMLILAQVKKDTINQTYFGLLSSSKLLQVQSYYYFAIRLLNSIRVENTKNTRSQWITFLHTHCYIFHLSFHAQLYN